MSDGHTTAEKNNYTVTFHPAFASRCAITGDDGECEVYKQSGPHHLNGESHPKQHKIHLKGGKYDRDVTLEIADPKHAIKRIHLELYGDRAPTDIGSAKVFPAVETFIADNRAVTCPPDC
ncbi:MAG TPA: hypothetical protein VGO40_08285 [Longimicrobium sp.]|jgi:hypothetical protein|nr:hypothetical protein [Longimicrobium sp.]